MAAQAEGRTGDKIQRPDVAYVQKRHAHHGRRDVYCRRHLRVPDCRLRRDAARRLRAYFRAAVRAGVRCDRLS